MRETPASEYIISEIKANSLGTVGSVNSANYAAANKGVEMKLNLAALGIPSGAQSVKLMAARLTAATNMEMTGISTLAR